MKKTYIIPMTQMVAVQQQTLIADSPLSFDSSETVQDNDDIGVKGDRTRPSDYNVWNDDWSK